MAKIFFDLRFLYNVIQKMSNNQHVWFVLVDGQGESFKGTTADIVKLSSDSIIAEFRDAVKLKYADSHLKGIAPSDLRVYTNKDAFVHK